MKRLAVWAGGIALLTAAWGVTQVTPGEQLTESSFIEAVDVGESAVGRDLALTVTDVAIADRLSDATGWAADGTWVVVDISAESRVTELGVGVGLGVLVIDGVTYRASERPASILGRRLQVGVPTTGSLAFEIPADLGAKTAVVQFMVSPLDWRLDSVVELEIDLGSLPRQAERRMLPTAGGGV